MKKSLCLYTLLALATPLSTLAKDFDPNLVNSKPITYVSDYPLKRHIDYSINGSYIYMSKLECTFTNASNKEVSLNIWTQPDEPQPYLNITLKPGSVAKPTTVTEDLQLRLFSKWWCGINLPTKYADKLNYCAYLSIADSTLKSRHPFSIWTTPITSKSVQYLCRIKPLEGRPSQFMLGASQE